MARLQRDHHTARTYYEEALDIARKLGAPYLIAVYANNLSAVTCILGDMQASRSYAIECLNENEALGDKMGIADAMNLFAALAIEAGDIKTGGSLFGASRSVSDSIGYVPEPLDREFRDHYVKKGREIAEEHFETALREGRSMGMKDAIALAKAN